MFQPMPSCSNVVRTSCSQRARSSGFELLRYAPNSLQVSGTFQSLIPDPLGTAHVAEVGTSTRKLLNYPFTGRYRDFTQWPAASQGYRLTFRVIVKAHGSARTLTYWVRPR